MSRPIFKTRRTEDPGKTHTGKMSSLRPVPYKRDPPRSHRLAQQVTASQNKSPPRTTSPGSAWCVGHDTRVEPEARATPPKHVGGTIPRALQTHELAVLQAAGPDKSLNASLSGCAAIPSTSSPTLSHASSARGTQAPSMTRSSLGLGPSVAG
jgi:hypothetical protein